MKRNHLSVLIVAVASSLWCASSWAGESEFSGAGIGFNVIDGNKEKFRENAQKVDGFVGGLEKLSVRGESGGLKYDAEGRALYEHDTALDLKLKSEGKGYMKLKLATDRHYYDSSFPYYYKEGKAFNPSTTMDTRLKTDRNDFGMELGAQLGPVKLYAGVEHSSKKGDASTFWGGRIVDQADDYLLWVEPFPRRLDFETNRVFGGVEAALGRFTLSLRQDVEKSYGSAHHDEPGYQEHRDVTKRLHNRIYISNIDHITRNTSAGFEGDIIEDKLNLDARYRFTRTDTWNNADSDAFGAGGAVQYNEHAINLIPSDHAGQRYLHAGNATLSWTGWDAVAPYMSVAVETGKDTNASLRRENGSNGGAADNNESTMDELVDFRTRNNENNVKGTVGASISAIPKTKVTVQFDIERSRVSHWWVADFQRQWFGGGNNSSTAGDWSWDADVIYRKRIYTLSARTRPFGWLSGNAKYRFTDQTVSPDNNWRYIENKLGDPEYNTTPVENFYPGRINRRTKPTHEVSLNVGIVPCPYVTLRPKLDFLSSSFNVDGEQFKRISTYQTSTWGLAADFLTPIPGLTARAGVSRRTGLSETLASDMSASVKRNPITGAAAANYTGGKVGGFSQDAITIDAQADYGAAGWNFNVNGGRTDARGSYPTLLWWTGAGVEYKVTKDMSAKVKGAYNDYSERFNGAINDYNAKLIAMTFSARFAR